MSAAWRNAVVESVVQRTPSVKSFFFRFAQPLRFRAGQHLDVRLTAPDGYQAQRSYSIASAPEAGESIELTIERLDDGEVSPFFHDVVAAGDEIELRGPIGGHFVWSVADGGPLLLVGGGSGIVPLASMLRHRSASGSSVPASLVYSARAVAELIYADELAAMHARADGFRFLPTVTRERDLPAGMRAGRIDDAMIAQALDGLGAAPLVTFVCGSNPFVESATRLLIAHGVPASAIRTERYGG
jgi:ferredoxin-NADP reductase